MKALLFIIIAAVFTACGSGNSKVEEKTGVTEEHNDEHTEGNENTVSLTTDQMKASGIELGIIELKNLTTSIKANGTLIVPNQNKAFVTSVNSGVLRSLSIQPGSFVRKGQTIATVSNHDAVRLQQDLQTTNAQISLAELELKRQTELVEGNAAPLKNLQRVRTELATLRASRNALSKQLSAMGISPSSVSKGNIITTIAVTAPISGTISTVTAQIGSSVDLGVPIAEIVNNSELHLDLFVYEKDLPKLHKGQVIHFTLTNSPGREYDAKIFSIGTAFASESKTIPIHAVVSGNKEGLIEGMNVTAVISIGTNVVPAVPTEAIVSYQGQDFIFIATAKKEESQTVHAHSEEEHKDEEHKEEDEGHHETGEQQSFERVQVIRGASDIGFTEITPVKNIPPNTPVIIKGAFFVLAKMTNTGGHDH